MRRIIVAILALVLGIAGYAVPAQAAVWTSSITFNASPEPVAAGGQVTLAGKAGFIDPGFSGHVTLELSNVANLPIKLWPGMKIGQLCIFRLSSPAEHPYGSAVYGSRYQGQRGPTQSRSSHNWRTWSTS